MGLLDGRRSGWLHVFSISDLIIKPISKQLIDGSICAILCLYVRPRELIYFWNVFEDFKDNGSLFCIFLATQCEWKYFFLLKHANIIFRLFQWKF